MTRDFEKSNAIYYTSSKKVTLTQCFEELFWLVLSVDRANQLCTTTKSALQAMMEQAYSQFCFQFGSFTAITRLHSIRILRSKCDQFFPSFWNDNNRHTFQITFNKIEYFPLPANLMLSVQSYLNYMKSSTPEISSACLFYRKKLIWSQLEESDTLNIFNYYIHNLQMVLTFNFHRLLEL